MAATRPMQPASCDSGRSRGQKTPPTKAPLRRISCGSGLGRDTADTDRTLRFRPLSGSEDPSYRGLALAQFLWERPWPRHGRCRPHASIRAAVGVRRPLLQESRSGAVPVGAALAATRPMQPARFDSGRCRGQKTPPAGAALRRGSCGSGLGRDTADAGHGLRFRPWSGSEDPSYRSLAPAQFPWERPWPRHGRCWPRASIQAAVGVRRPLLQEHSSGEAQSAGARDD